MVDYPIVATKTADGLKLSGLLLVPQDQQSDTILIHIHGTAGNFYYHHNWAQPVSSGLTSHKIAVLWTNNRGAEVYEYYKGSITQGAAAEKFEDSVLDIDAWIGWAHDQGYKNIILSGHSLGTEKVTHYMSYGRHTDNIIGLVLLGFADSYGWHHQRLTADQSTAYLSEASQMVEAGRGDELMTDLFVHAGVLPQTANSYLSFFSPESALSKALPLRDGEVLTQFSHINVPILGVIGTKDEWAFWGVEKMSQKLLDANSLARVSIIEDADHEFSGHEKKLVDSLLDWLQKNFPDPSRA